MPTAASGHSATLPERPSPCRAPASREEIFLSGSDPRIPQAVDVFSIEDRSVQYAMLACGYVDAIAAHETASCNT